MILPKKLVAPPLPVLPGLPHRQKAPVADASLSVCNGQDALPQRVPDEGVHPRPFYFNSRNLK